MSVTVACLIRQMGYLVFATPQVEQSAADLSMMLGARVVQCTDILALMSTNRRRCEVAFVQAEQAGIRAVGLEAVDGAAVDEVRRRAIAEDCRVLSEKPSAPDVECAVRFRSPFGPIFEVHSPVRRDANPSKNDPGVRARRLDHVNLRVSDPRGFHDFMIRALGMRLSDRTEDYSRAWYRAADGFHHTVAAAPGEGLHHFGFDAFSVLDLVALADTLALHDRSLLWGIGRHGPGNNIFSYYRDPNGCVVELSFGMERIDCDAMYEPGIWTAETADRMLDLWGSNLPPAYAPALTPFVE